MRQKSNYPHQPHSYPTAAHLSEPLHLAGFPSGRISFLPHHHLCTNILPSLLMSIPSSFPTSYLLLQSGLLGVWGTEAGVRDWGSQGGVGVFWGRGFIRHNTCKGINGNQNNIAGCEIDRTCVLKLHSPGSDPPSLPLFSLVTFEKFLNFSEPQCLHL